MLGTVRAKVMEVIFIIYFILQGRNTTTEFTLMFRYLNVEVTLIILNKIIKCSKAAIQPGFLSYQVDYVTISLVKEFSAWLDRKPNWITALEDWVEIFSIWSSLEKMLASIGFQMFNAGPPFGTQGGPYTFSLSSSSIYSRALHCSPIRASRYSPTRYPI